MDTAPDPEPYEEPEERRPRRSGTPTGLIIAALSALVLILLIALLVVLLMGNFRSEEGESSPSPTVVAALASPAASPTASPVAVASPTAVPPTPTPVATPTPTVTAGEPTVYTIAQGDTLDGIAARFGVPADLVGAANQLNGTTLPAVGSPLFIPSGDGLLPPASPNQAVHRVGPGESLGAISVKYDISAQSIAIANNLTDVNHVEAGWILLIPREEITNAPPGATGTPPAEPDTQATSYTVQFGDSLDSIARRFGVTTQALQEANGITDPNHVEVGQVLKIPR